jgi:uncharacterized protein (DUF1778 family)
MKEGYMKQDRIELRASQKERELLFEAALFSGMTLSSFLRQAALEKSEEVLKHRDSITLSDRDRAIFMDALENPPKPNKQLVNAFKFYHAKKSSMIVARSKKKKAA